MPTPCLPLAVALCAALPPADPASPPAGARIQASMPDSRAQYQAFEVATPLAGNQAFEGAFGFDFDVGRSPLLVRGLGAFDDGQDGLNAAIGVRLYERTSASLLASTVFATGTGARLSRGYRIADLATALLLPAGFRGSIVASGYGDARERRYDNGTAAFPGSIAAGGFVAFVGGGRSGFDAAAFPTTVDVGPAVRYAGPNFVFTALPAAVGEDVPTSTVPEPATWALVGAGLVLLGAASARRRAATSA